MPGLRVFELMNELKNMPAGATVEINSLISVSELTKFPHCDDCYSYSCNVSEVEYRSDSETVILYN